MMTNRILFTFQIVSELIDGAEDECELIELYKHRIIISYQENKYKGQIILSGILSNVGFFLEVLNDLDIIEQHGQLKDSLLMIKWYVILSLYIYIYVLFFLTGLQAFIFRWKIFVIQL